MTVSLHAALVPTWLQMLGGLSNVLDKAVAHCEANGIDTATLADLKIAPDMFDFAYQVKAAGAHSLDCVDGARAGVFTPAGEAPRDVASMKAALARAVAGLEAIAPEDMEAFADRPVELRFNSFTLPFASAEDFLLSFAQPNFFFHVTMAYAVLRNFGVAIGKGDYMGNIRANFG